MSSTCLARFGKISLTSIPDCPYFLKPYGEGRAAPVLRSVGRWSGMTCPAYFCRAGFGSNVSTWEGPPFMNRKMTRLAFAGKGGFLGAIGLNGAIWSLDWPDANADSVPN